MSGLCHFLLYPLFLSPSSFPAQRCFIFYCSALQWNHFWFATVRRKILRILNLPTISHLNKPASWSDARLLHTVIVASPGSVFYLCSYFIHFSISASTEHGLLPLPPSSIPLSIQWPWLPCTVNEMWHCHMYLDKIYQRMNWFSYWFPWTSKVCVEIRSLLMIVLERGRMPREEQAFFFFHLWKVPVHLFGRKPALLCRLTLFVGGERKNMAKVWSDPAED
jgi:hypothetical protein